MFADEFCKIIRRNMWLLALRISQELAIAIGDDRIIFREFNVNRDMLRAERNPKLSWSRKIGQGVKVYSTG